MRYALLGFAALLLSGCAGVISDAMGEHARAECTEETNPSARRACLDEAEQRRN